MNKQSGLAIMLLAVVFSVAFSWTLQDKCFGAVKGGQEIKAVGMVWRLDLTKDQRDNISAKETSVRQEIAKLRQSIRDLRISLNAELSADKQDETKINGLIDNISKSMADIQKKEVFFMLWIRGQLTPEQKQKLQLLIKDRPQSGAGGPGAESR